MSLEQKKLNVVESGMSFSVPLNLYSQNFNC